jgi:hypothetical protein
MNHHRPTLAAAVALCLCATALPAQQKAGESLPGAESVMVRVAANQDQSQAERAHYVYVQHAKMSSRRGNTVKCEEITDYRVTPEENGSHQQLLKLDGRMLQHHQYVHYTALLDKNHNSGSSVEVKKDDSTADGDHNDLSVTVGGDSADREIVENMRQNLTQDKSKDGLSAHLFPLTTDDQKDYTFRMLGRERLNGRDVYHIVFRPKDNAEYAWRGDAYIDTAAYQPVLVTTGLSRKIPFAVRTFLGTNLPGLGFTVTYAPQPDGVWFPTTFSTEFKIEVLFFFRRQIILDAQNRDFEKTHGDVKIVGQATPVEPQQR